MKDRRVRGLTLFVRYRVVKKKKKERLKVLFVGNCDVVTRVSNAVVPDGVSVRNDFQQCP